MTPRKQCLLDRTDSSCMNSQRLWQHAQYVQGLNRSGPDKVLARGKKYTQTPALTQELFPIDNPLKMKELFPPVEGPHKPCFRPDTLPTVDKQHKINSMALLEVVS